MALLIEGAEASAKVELDVPAAKIREQVEQGLYQIAESETGRGGVIGAGDSAAAAIALAGDAYRNGGRLTGVTTGLADLDKLLGGMQDGHLVVLAGRPSMGKTTLAGAISVSAARYFADTDAHKAVVEFELEMSHQEMSLRRLSAITGIEIERIKRGRLDQGEWLSLNEAQAQLDRLPLLTDDTPKLGMAEIRSRARRIARHHGLGLVMLDHIGLIRPQRHAQGNRTAEITEITG